MNSRPKGALAQALYCKLNNDLQMENFDYRSWYQLGPDTPDTIHHICPRYKAKFVEMSVDDSTKQFLEEARETSSKLWTQIYHIIARLFLGLFMTQTDLNGFLRRGSMFVLSEQQFKKLLTVGGFDQNNFSENQQMIDILDIGAGDGLVTVRLAKGIMSGTNILLKVFCTETSFFMRERLQERKFTVIESIRDVEKVHLISCLNVLDRCSDPFEILTDIHETLAVNGRAIIALVLPYSHYVEKNSSHMPNQLLLPDSWTKQRQGQVVTFEAEVVEFFRQLEKYGFVIEAWTKAPYLCEGDIRQSFYWLTDIVVVVSRAIDKHHASCNSIRMPPY
uniref:CSON000642 protein n=1 Tax=Culicoides sonorensis TaxID=179676 RepID=A0A336K8Q6_CULSO